MTDHAREAAKKIMPDPSWFPDDDPECCYETKLAEKTAVIQSAIDAACAERDKRIAELEEKLHQANQDYEDISGD